MSDVASVIKALREERGLSKSRLAREAKVSDAYIVQIEKGERHPSAQILHRLAHALRVPPHHLLIPAGHYTAEDLARAEEYAQEFMPTHVSDDSPPDLKDRLLNEAFKDVELDRALESGRLTYEEYESHPLALPSEKYWGWHRPLDVWPAEGWDELSEADRTLVQKLINRLREKE